MAGEKPVGAVAVKRSGTKTTIEITVPKGTKLRDTLKILDTVRSEAVTKFLPGPCNACHSGRDFRLRELARVLPARMGKNMAAFDLKSGKLIR